MVYDCNYSSFYRKVKHLTMLSFGPSSEAWAQTNTAYGTGALSNNTTGSQDSAFGVSALGHNTTGSGNTATGWDALYFNTTVQQHGAWHRRA
jgi:hypothetical protein